MRPRAVPWRQAAFAVVDLELTGLDPRRDEIVSWCAVPVDGGAIDVGGIREGLVRPARRSGDAAIRVHGLRDDDLAEAAAGADAVLPLADALTGRILVAHAAQVELTFLAPVLERLGRPRIRRAIDTAELAQRVDALELSGANGAVVALGVVAEYFGLPVHAPHTAAGDALTTAQAFLALAARLDAARPQTVRSLLRRPRW